MSDEEREERSRGFVVIDRRGQEDEEEEREPRAPEPEARPAPGAGAPEAGPAGAAGAGAGPGAAGAARPAGPPRGPAPPVDFGSFVQSIAISALHWLGLVADPETGQTAPPNLPLAQQNIDILEMLQEKTRGNLSPEEANLLENLLYELRLHYVEVSRSAGG